MDFKNKVVLITGSSSGIGAAAAEHFAKYSAKVVIVGRNEERLKEVAKKVETAKGIKPMVITADMTNDDDVRRIVTETLKDFKQIDILVNNAGAAIAGRLQDGVDPLDKTIALNLRSVYLLTSLAVPHLIKSKGNIINISSIMSVKVNSDFIPYCISKAGLDMFTKCIAKELAGNGVRVNSVNPGPVKTNFQRNLGLTEDEIEKFIDIRVKRSPLGFISTSANIAEVIVYLASDKARSITGSTYVIDHGDLLA